MNKLFIPFVVILMYCLINSCSDFIEKDINNSAISLLAPADNQYLSNSSVLFWWDNLKGAEKYNLQIVKPNFSSTQQLIVDTMVIGNKFTISLLPGTYQWRVQGINNGGSTKYSTRTLIVDSTSNLATQTILLVSPADNYVTNVFTQNFKWETLYNASEYRFQIINNSNNQIVTEVALTVDTFSYTLPEGSFKWQVRGENSSTVSPYSARTITFDTSKAIASTISTPANRDSVLSPVILTWQRNSKTIADSLYIYSDSLVSAPILNIYSSTLSYSFSGIAQHKYFWRLRSFNAVGNKSDYSALYSFYIKQ